MAAVAASRQAVTPEVNASGVTPRLFAMRGSDVLRMAPSQYHEKRRSHNQRDPLVDGAGGAGGLARQRWRRWQMCEGCQGCQKWLWCQMWQSWRLGS